MKTPLAVCLLLATTFASADVADEVRCREIGFSRSAEMRDAEAFATFIDADARFVGGAVNRGPQEVTEAWAAFFAEDGPAIKWRPQFVEVLEDSTLALTRGPYRMITTDDQGVQTEHWGTFNSVWRLQTDGSWKVVFDAGDSSAEAPSDETQALLEQEDNCST
jgi:ketosteroid isomerase-like protein